MSNRSRYGYVGLALLIGAAFLLGLGSDRFGQFSVIVLGGLVGATLSLWYHVEKRKTNRWDERSERIQLRASTMSYSVLLIGLGTLAAFVTGADADPPIELLLWVFTIGGVLLNEGFKRWYGRVM